jgi:hypothetical protein
MGVRRPVTYLLLAVAAFILAGCSAIDVVGRTAISTFQALMDATSGSVALDAAANRWVLTSQGGERFTWSADFAGTASDFQVSFDATPFLAAGLDAAKLPAERYTFDAASAILTLSFEAGGEKFTYAGAATPGETFRKIVAAHRSIIGYHAALDHYGIALGDGNMFEWAKDMAKNDKDIVFVLNPEPFRAAGVDPARITGWIFTQIPVKDASGKTVDVDKFVKPYNLE